MLELMPAPQEAKPRLAEGVLGNVAVSLTEHDSLRIASAKNPIEYIANSIVEQEVDLIADELIEEVEVYLNVYSGIREYVIAAHNFGMHSWN